MTSKRAIAQGYLFEVLIREIVRKAGFDSNIYDSKQVTKTGRFRGRGGTHQIDVYGEFKFTSPFIYPINIIGEVKGYYTIKNKVSLNVARSFCGVIKDIQEWYNIDTTKGGLTRFQKVGEKRYNHCGVIFSLTGFRKSAIEYCWAQGIYTISYENNPIMKNILDIIGELPKATYITRVNRIKRSFCKNEFTDLNKSLKENQKRNNFDEVLNKIIEEINSIHSYFGMLNGKFVCNILAKTKYIEDYPWDDLSIKLDKNFELYGRDGEFLGNFSLPSQFLSFYLKKKSNIEKMFSYIDVFFVKDNILSVKKFYLTEESINSLAERIPEFIKEESEDTAD